MSKVVFASKTAVQKSTENQIPTGFRLKAASLLSSIPEPATQSAALQLYRNNISLDRSLALFAGLVGLAILEEMI